jgi:sugar lactone lactonase YvrE
MSSWSRRAGDRHSAKRRTTMRFLNPAMLRLALCFLSLAAVSLTPAGAQEPPDEWGADRWILQDAQVVDYLGRKALIGSAMLKDVDFTNGVIEVDVAVSGAGSYPGIIFRAQSDQDFERLYLRPHRLAQYQDGIQYTPSFNGVSGWQLYNGPGYTAGATIPPGSWIHMKLEVLGTRARFFLGETPAPALVVNDLKHGLSHGSIGLLGPKDGSAYFSNFRYQAGDSLSFDPPPPVEVPPGIITRWSLSQTFKFTKLDTERPPSEQKIPPLEWVDVESEAGGLVDISRTVARPTGENGEPDCIFARTTLRGDDERPFKLLFGYSDAVTIFLNGRPLFSGSSGYRQRDPSFVGAIGFFDSVYLPLRKGDNELLFLITEQFGGWGFMASDGDAIFQAPSLEKVFETGRDLAVPESAAYDPARNVIYVSNYDPFPKPPTPEGHFLSRLDSSGKIENLQWVTGLDRPAGLAVGGDKLYVVERTCVAEIDIATAQVTKRYPIQGAQLLNDVAVGPSGNIYVSDSRRNLILRISGGQVENWLTGPEIGLPNGLCVDGGRLLVGCNSDRRLKSIDLATKSVTPLAQFAPGLIDGVAADGRGNVLVSHNEGRIYRVGPSGGVEKILDLSVQGVKCADFGYAPEKGLLVIPTMVDCRVLGYRVRG